MSDRTPGPWIVNVGEVPSLGGLALGVIRDNHKHGEVEPSICIIARMDRVDDADRANALLIAAAPDLLSMLEEMIDNCEEPPERNCSCHLSAPCGSCEHQEMRGLFERARGLIDHVNRKESA